MVIRKIALILCVALGLMSNFSWASRIVFYPCSEDSEELINTMRAVNSPDWDIVTQAVKNIYTLSEKGDWGAFQIVCQFKENDEHNLDDYISSIYKNFLTDKNYSAMGKYGIILIHLDKPEHALPFLATALQHRLKYKYSLDILEIKYADAITRIEPQKLGTSSKVLEFYEQAWDLSQKHLNKTDDVSKKIFLNFLKRIKLLNFERLINNVGHYLIVNIKSYFCYYNDIFKNTTHLNRLYRQRNTIFLNIDNDLELCTTFDQAMDAKKLREDNFIESARQSVKQGAIQAIGKLFTRNFHARQALKSFGVNNLSQLSPEQKNTMALFLLAVYPNRIFDKELMDNEEYIDRFLSSNTEKFNFLTQEVFEAI